MRVCWVLLLLCSSTVLAASEERYSVIVGGTPVGHLIARIDGNEVRIDYDYKNNGRGPTITEQLRLDGNGLPLRWRIRGSSTFGNKVDERYERRGRDSRWTDSVGPGKATSVEPVLYVGQSASPWALGLYARALLADGQSLPALPGGQVTLAPADASTFTDANADATGPLSAYAIHGLDLNPSHILLDDAKALFAFITPRMVVVRAGREAQDEQLRALAADLSVRRLQQLQELTAHRFEAPIRISNVRIFQPRQLALSEPVSVLVYRRQIASIQPVDSPPSPGEVQIDGEGGTLVAGLYEMHAHTNQDGALLNIAAGVTSIRDMGNNNAVLDELIERIESGLIAGPRIIRAGFIEGRSPYSSNNGILVDSQQRAIDAVRWYAARGFRQVKLYNSMNPAWAVATAAEAHRLGLRVSGHVPAFANADAMIDAGFDELTHINQIMLGWVLMRDEDTRTLLRLTALRRLPSLDLDSVRVQRTIDRIVERGIAVEPTIAIHERLLLSRNGEVPIGAFDYLDHLPVGVQRNSMQALSDLSDPADAKAYAAAFEQILATLRILRERGVQLIPGTDLGGSFAYHRELELFSQIGYSPAEVLKLATLDMAVYLGQDQHLGSIEKDKLADFFLIQGDPTVDLKAIKAIRMVVKDGTLHFPAEIYPHFGIKPFAEAPTVQMPKG